MSNLGRLFRSFPFLSRFLSKKSKIKAYHYLTAGGVFPERLLDQLIKRLRKENDEIMRIPHPAEFSK